MISVFYAWGVQSTAKKREFVKIDHGADSC